MVQLPAHITAIVTGMVRVGLVLNVVAATLAWLWAMAILPNWVQLL